MGTDNKEAFFGNNFFKIPSCLYIYIFVHRAMHSPLLKLCEKLSFFPNYPWVGYRYFLYSGILGLVSTNVQVNKPAYTERVRC